MRCATARHCLAATCAVQRALSHVRGKERVAISEQNRFGGTLAATGHPRAIDAPHTGGGDRAARLRPPLARRPRQRRRPSASPPAGAAPAAPGPWWVCNRVPAVWSVHAPAWPAWRRAVHTL